MDDPGLLYFHVHFHTKKVATAPIRYSAVYVRCVSLKNFLNDLTTYLPVSSVPGHGCWSVGLPLDWQMLTVFHQGVQEQGPEVNEASFKESWGLCLGSWKGY